MNIYTRTGDDGSTGLVGGSRVSKADARVHAYGTVDEANSCIGLARSFRLCARSEEMLAQVQHELFRLAAEIATAPEAQHKLTMERIEQQDVELLESYIDEVQQTLPPLKFFVLPAGTTTACMLHQARTVVRRAERCVVELGVDHVRPQPRQYLNRLSDLLFVLARLENQVHKVADEAWHRPETNRKA